jgi:GNAT superfamily N-acetyltransferase
MGALAYLDEDHIWYLLDLGHVEQLPLAAGYELRVADEADLEGYAALTTTATDEARERRANGAELWLVVRDREYAFACWIFPRETPVRAAADRVLELPSRVACLEDSFTGPSHRGHGIAGAAWTMIARELKSRGFEMLITKVEVENEPSRRAVEKAGFRGASVMHLRCRGWRERVSFDGQSATLNPAEEAVSAELERALAR